MSSQRIRRAEQPARNSIEVAPKKRHPAPTPKHQAMLRIRGVHTHSRRRLGLAGVPLLAALSLAACSSNTTIEPTTSTSSSSTGVGGMGGNPNVGGMGGTADGGSGGQQPLNILGSIVEVSPFLPRPIVGGEEVPGGRWLLTSHGADVTLNDLQLVALSHHPTSVNAIRVSGGPNCETTFLSNFLPMNSGIYDIESLGHHVPEGDAGTMLCVDFTPLQVPIDGVTLPTEPSYAGVALLNVTEVIGPMGNNHAGAFMGQPFDPTAQLTTGIDDACTSFAPGGCSVTANPLNEMVSPGDVLVINEEMLLVGGPGNPSTTTPPLLYRGFAHTSKNPHSSGSPIRQSTLAQRVVPMPDTNSEPDGYMRPGDVVLNLTAGVSGNPSDLCFVGSITPLPMTFDDYPLVPLPQTPASACSLQTPLPGNEMVRFPSHGNLHRLFRAYPHISTNSMGNVVNPTSDTVMMAFTVEARGDTVRFYNNGAGSSSAIHEGLALPATAANQMVFTLDSTEPLTGTGVCTLWNISNAVPLATINTIPTPQFPYIIHLPFNFNLNSFAIAEGLNNAVDMEVRCDMASIMAADPSGTIFEGIFLPRPFTIEWGTNVTSDMTEEGLWIVPGTIVGNIVIKP